MIKRFIPTLLWLSSTQLIASPRTPIEMETQIIEIPVKYTIEKMRVACVVEAHEDAVPFLYFSKRDYFREKEIRSEGLKKRLTLPSARCSGSGRLPLVSVLPYSNHEEVKKAIEEAGGFVEVDILFHNFNDSQIFYREFVGRMMEKIKGLATN